MTEDTVAGCAAAAAPPHSNSRSWDRLKTERNPKLFAAAWLDIQCQLISGKVLQGGVVFGEPDKGPFTPIAMWPAGSLGSPGLASTIENAMSKRRSTIETARRLAPDNRQKYDAIAVPLLVDEQICGAVAVEIEHSARDLQLQVTEQLEWGSEWLKNLVHRNRFTASDRLVTVLELVATGLQHDRFQAAATAVATELAAILHCERVSIGFLRFRHTRVRALSHSASFGKKSNIIRAMEAAMDEAIDQHATVIFPASEEGPMQVTRAQEALAKKHGTGCVCTVPFTEGERILGAMTLERPSEEPFDARTVQLCEHVASLLGPLLDVRRKDDRWLIQKAGDSLRNHCRNLIGPRHVALKLSTTIALIVIAFLSLTYGEYQVTADARLEGAVQRSISVPMAGYVAQSDVRAGDIVKRGDTLFSLDARDLRLERLKWMSQKSQYSREHSEAQADHDRAKVRILGAQIEQARAQVALIDEQLERINVVAPFDSLVVSGDLSQSLGAPVERGDVLFEVAPVDDYRVILKVDERDIGELAIGQSGWLALSSMPHQSIAIKIKKMTPVSTAEEGINYFRVEALLVDKGTRRLSPGMEGVAKVDIEQRKLIWIWTHKISHWIRLFFWSWWP